MDVYKSPPSFDTTRMYQCGDQLPRTGNDPARATPRATYLVAPPMEGASTLPVPAFARSESAMGIFSVGMYASPPSMSRGTYASPPSISPGSHASPPPGAAYAPVPATWSTGYFDPTIGPAYISKYPLALSSSPPTARQSPASRMINRSSSSGESTSFLSASSMSLGSAVAPGPPSPPPSFRLVRTTSGPTVVVKVPGSSPKSRGPRSVQGDDKPRSPRKGGRAKGAGDALDTADVIARAKSSGVSDWHLITADGDDDGPPQPRDPLGPKRYSKYYQ